MAVTAIITLVSWWLGYALMGWFTYYCMMAFSRYIATNKGDRWSRERFESDFLHTFFAVTWPITWFLATIAFTIYLIGVTSKKMFFSLAKLLNHVPLFYGLFDR